MIVVLIYFATTHGLLADIAMAMDWFHTQYTAYLTLILDTLLLFSLHRFNTLYVHYAHNSIAINRQALVSIEFSIVKESAQLSTMSRGAGSAWNKQETLKLTEVWGGRKPSSVHKQLQKCKRNQTVYEVVAKEMREAGYEWTYHQCRDKTKKLKVSRKRTSRTTLEDELPGISSM